ncbi:MAG: hypothetical protein AAF975_00900 [Spirochaetota bacterium]
MFKKRKYQSLAMVCLLLFSCNLRNNIVLEGEGKGSMALSLSLPKYMLDSVDLVAASIPGGEDLLEPENMAKGLRRSKDISEVKVLSPQKGSYDIRFRFQNFNSGKNGKNGKGSGPDFFVWSREPGGNTQLSIVVNRQTYRELERRFPGLRDNALLQLYGPATTEGMDRNDYLDMVEYSFGAQARKDLPEAEAVISVQVPHQVVSQSGGSRKNRNTVEFRLRLLDFALLTQEKRYSVVYR